MRTARAAGKHGSGVGLFGKGILGKGMKTGVVLTATHSVAHVW